MQQLELFTLVRSTLLAQFATRAGMNDVEVETVYQGQTIGPPAGPTVTMQSIINRRIGAVRRHERLLDPLTFQHEETQWWESTLQIGTLARRDPNDPAFLTLPTAMDICKAASNILQSDAGLALLAAQRVRPLRITDVRNLQWVNESDQYEAMPSFDLVLSYPEIILGTTPAAQSVKPDIGRV